MLNFDSNKLFAAGFSLALSGIFLAMAIVPASPGGLIA
ncbi:recombination protein F [Erythrobacter sp. QSSC1-22B]|nr:recombination protein F [Erythrobacter sp. QSSC1-22B]